MGWQGFMELPSTGIKELKSGGKIFIKCPYDFASEVRYIVNVRKFELVKKNVPPLGLCFRYAYAHGDRRSGELCKVSPPVVEAPGTRGCWAVGWTGPGRTAGWSDQVGPSSSRRSSRGSDRLQTSRDLRSNLLLY